VLEKDPGCTVERTLHQSIVSAGTKTKTKSHGKSGTTEAIVFWPCGERKCR